MELVHWWRDYMRDAPTYQPREVNGGPLLDNVLEGAAIDLSKIPTPVWHEHDGGAFIGTACMVVMKDPDLAGSTTAPIASRHRGRTWRP